jgi:hypothetical protein
VAWLPSPYDHSRPKTRVLSQLLRNAPRGSCRSTRRVKLGQALVKRSDGSSIREEYFAPMGPRFVGDQRRFDVHQYPLDSVLLRLPGEVDGNRMLAILRAQPQLIPSHSTDLRHLMWSLPSTSTPTSYQQPSAMQSIDSSACIERLRHTSDVLTSCLRSTLENRMTQAAQTAT